MKPHGVDCGTVVLVTQVNKEIYPEHWFSHASLARGGGGTYLAHSSPMPLAPPVMSQSCSILLPFPATACQQRIRAAVRHYQHWLMSLDC